MPIRPENKARYPRDWLAISCRIRDRAGNKCEECGVPNYQHGGRDPQGGWHKTLPTGDDGIRLTWPRLGEMAWCEGWQAERLRVVRIVLTVAHLNHTPEDCRPENLKAWCQRCHNRYDMAERRKGTKERARAASAVGDLFKAEETA